MTSPKSNPKDAQVMASILKDMGIIEYEPRVINQMLEFTYRYVTNILDDSRLFCSHAKKKSIDVEDVRLAIQLQMDRSFTTPPPRDILIEIARQKNNIPMPLIKANIGPKLPPDRYSLTATNYRMKSLRKPRSIMSSSRNLNLAPMHSNASISKLTPAISLSSKSGATLSVMNKGGGVPSPTVAISSRGIKNVPPTPIIKLSSGPPMMSSAKDLPLNGEANKRKRDQMDDYDE